MEQLTESVYFVTERAPDRLGPFLWSAWLAYTHRASEYQGRVFLGFVYYLPLGVGSLLARLSGRELLDLNTKDRPSYWRSRAQPEKTLASLERQF